MKTIKVLLVDDEVMIKKVLADKVNWSRFDMEIVGVESSAREALLFIDKYPVDLIITDMKMPFKDGNRLIEEAITHNKNLRFLVLSAYTDFSMVRKSFKLGVYDYLQKSDINTSVMDDVLIKLRNEIIYDRQEKNAVFSMDMVSAIINEPIIEASGLYQVFFLEFRNEMISSEVLNFLKNINAPDSYIVQYLPPNVTLLIRHKQNSFRCINEKTQKLLGKMISFFNANFGFLIGVSSINTGANIDYLKKEAERAIIDSFYASINQKVFYYQETDKLNDERLKPLYWKDRLRKDIGHMDLNSATATMFEMLSYIENKKPYKEICKELIFELYYFYINYVNNVKIINLEEIVDLKHKDIFAIIQHFDRFTKLNEWLSINLDNIKNKYILEYKSNITEMIKAYISLNIADDLSLNKISQIFGASNSYISHLFKINEGISLRKYISNFRLLKAQDYIINTKMMVKDICELTGYNSLEHFSREFKRKFDMSPNQYRRKRSM